MNYYDEHESMNIGYAVVTGIATPFELIEQTCDPIIFPFDPTDITCDNVSQLEYYFASIDDFEKAIVLRDYFI
jgi:hypothetical protein